MESPPTETPLTKNIIILGASTAGITSAHYYLRHIIPHLSNPTSYHVTLIDPSTAWFNRVQSPRGVVSEELMAIDKFMVPLADGFKSYPAKTFTLVQGKAVAMDPTTRTVNVELASGSTTLYNYFALVIATGASSASPLLGVQGNHTQSVKAINAFRKKLPEAKSIIIAGGGPAAVETAGEIGEFLNGKPGWFTTRPKVVKTKITVVTDAPKLLPVLRLALAEKAEKALNAVGVDVVYNARVDGTTPERAGKLDAQGGLGDLLSPTTVKLADGKTLKADLYIPAIGLTPNTAWMPKDLLDERGKVDTNKKTLRVDKAGPRVYAFGEVGNYGKGGLMEIMMASQAVILVNMKRDFLHADKLESSGEEKTAATGKDKEFENKLGESQFVPIGKSAGVGAIFGWRMPGFLVRMIKGKTFFVENNVKTVHGESVKKDVKWKYM